jgi:hypothetical protein
VIARVIAGASLAQLCKQAEVVFWLRKLPPEAFVRPLPRLPEGNLFHRQIANHLPRSPRLAAAWLQTVADAAETDGEQFALWIARGMARDAKKVKLDCMRRIGLWAWFSVRPETLGHTLVDKPWDRPTSVDRALDASRDWLRKVELRVNLGDVPIADMWLQPRRVGGYDFVPLRTAAEVAEEAVLMKNCATGYGSQLAHNRSRLWSMQRDGVRVATLQVARRYRDPLPNIVQLQTARNKGASVALWWAARQWLNAHDLPRVTMNERALDAAPLDRASWVAFWRPYWLDRGRLPDWLPLCPSRDALKALLRW